MFLRRLTFVLPVALIAAGIAASAGLTAKPVVKKTLTVSVNGSGRLVSSPRGVNCFTVCSVKFRKGTNVRLVPIANPGWQFSGWSGACRGAGGCAVRMNSAHVVLVTFTQKPPPPPPIPLGHYTGKTADNENWQFDVVASGGGEAVANLQTGQMNMSCNPADYYLYGGNLAAQGPYALDSQGGFTIDLNYPNTVGSSASIDTAHITGHITTTGVAAGTYQKNTQFSTNGISYNCSTGVQSWTGSKTS